MKMTDKIDLLLSRSGTTRAELARKTGIPYTTISSLYDRGYENIKLANLMRIADFFGVSLGYLGDDSADAETDGETAELCRDYAALSARGRRLTRRLMDELREYEAEDGAPQTPRVEYIREYLTPAAAGYASPAEGEDYILTERAQDAPKGADFTVRIDGDSMEPYIKDGSRVYVARMERLEDGDVGIFFVDGDMKCKQYCEDSFGNIYLFSLNRRRADADVTVRASGGLRVVCFGKVLLPKRPPLPKL